MNPVTICRSEGLRDFHLGRLTISYDVVREVLSSGRGLSEAPGVWYFDFGHGWRLSWRRRWVVWGDDHPQRWENIKHYDQFRTFAKHGRPT